MDPQKPIGHGASSGGGGVSKGGARHLQLQTDVQLGLFTNGAHEMMSITDFIAVDGSSSSSSAGFEEEELDSGTIKRISTLIQSEYEAQAVRVSSTAKKSGMKKKTKI